MRRQHWIALGSLLGFLALFLGSTPAQQAPRPNQPQGLPQRIAAITKVPLPTVNLVLQTQVALVREDLKQGKSVSLPGLGTFRIVRVAAHKDLRNGRPVEIPAVNTVEFLADGPLDTAANAESAVPAETVPEFKYIPLPTQTPGLKEPRNRVPPQRVP
jgi:nucleoid DNA-binding protein